MSDIFAKKIIKNNDKFIIFYSEWCTYSKNALALLKDKKKSFKGYKIESIKGGIERLMASFNNNREKLAFDISHKTRPIIFYKGKFIGGFTELKEFLDKN